MPERISEVLLRYKTDKRSIADTTRGAAAVEKGVTQSARKTVAETQKATAANEAFAKSFQFIERSEKLNTLAAKYGELAARTKEPIRLAQQLGNELSAIGATDREVEQVAKAVDQMADSLKRAEGSAVATRENLDAVRGFRQEGRLQSFGTSTLTSLLPGGGGAVGQAAVSAFNFLDTIPKIGPAFDIVRTSITSNISSIVTSMGPFGVAAAAIGGAIVLAGKQIVDTLAEVEGRVKAGIVARRQVEELADGGSTLEEAQRFIEEQQRIIERETRILQTEAARYDSAFAAATEELGDVGGRVAFGLLQIFSSAEEASTEAVETATQNIRDAQARLEQVQGAIDAGRFDEATSLRMVEQASQDRIQALMREADSIGALMQAEQRSMSASVDQNRQRLQQIDNERSILERQIQVLRQSGDTSEEVTQRIEELTRQLGQLGQEAEFISSAGLGAAAGRERLEAQRRANQELKALEERSAQERIRLAEQFSQRQIDLAKRQAKEEEALLKRLQESLVNLERNLQRDLNKQEEQRARQVIQAQIDFQRKEADAALRQFERLSDLRKQAGRDERRALMDRNFRAIFENRERLTEQIEDAQTSYDRERRDALKAFSDQQGDRQKAFVQERQDRLRAAAQARADLREDYAKRKTELAQAQAEQRSEMQAAYAQQMADLKTNLTAQLELRRQALAQELALLRQALSASRSTALPMSGSSQLGGPNKPVKTSTTSSNVPVPTKAGSGITKGDTSVVVNVNGGDPNKIVKTIKKAIAA